MELKLGYIQTDIELVPEDWNVVQLGQVADKVGSGITPTGGSRVYREYGRPFIRIQNVGWGILDLSDVAFIDDATHATFDTTQIRSGDVLLTITGYVGRSAVADSRIEGGNVNQHVCIIRADQNIFTPGYLCSYLISFNGRRQIDRFQAGSSRSGLNLDQVRSIRIAVPETISEQHAINTVLCDTDSLLECLGRLIAKKRDLKQAVMHQLLTGETRLPGFNEKWKKTRLGNYVTFLRNGVNSRAELLPEGQIKYLHYGDIHASKDIYISTVSLPYIPDTKAKSLDRLQEGDLIFVDTSEDIAGVSKSVEVRDVGSEEFVSGLHTIAVRFDKKVLADGFKGFLQFCPPLANQLRRLAAGTKVYATNRTHIADVELPLPSIPEQTAIARVLSDMDAEIFALEQRRAKTKDIKQAMMQELLTGKTRLVTPGGSNA